MMPLGQFGVDGCHLIDGGGRQGGGTGAARNIGAGVLVIMLATIYVIGTLGGNSCH